MKDIDVGFTHVAFMVRDTEKASRSIADTPGWTLFIRVNPVFLMPEKWHG